MPSTIQWSDTGLRAEVNLDVRVVRGVKRHPCSRCKRRRIVFALALTEAALGNPSSDWLCGECSGVRL